MQIVKRILIVSVALIVGGCCGNFNVDEGRIIHDVRMSIEKKEIDCKEAIIYLDNMIQCERTKPWWAIFRDCTKESTHDKMDKPLK